MATQALICTTEPQYKQPATPSTTGKRGPVTRRRFQKGCFVKEPDGGMYSMFYADAENPDGVIVSKRVKHFIGNLNRMSERAARREHARIMDGVNHKRGSTAPVYKGQTFADNCAASRELFAGAHPASIRPLRPERDGRERNPAVRNRFAENLVGQNRS